MRRVMTKGEETRERIIASAAPVFNTRGYAGTTMADLMAASGLEKGGIYRHFESKDELALAAFDHAWAASRDRVQSYVNVETTSVGRLIAVARGMASLGDDPPIAGGCPLLNTATESDSAEGDTYDALRERSRRGLRALIAFTRKLIQAGMTSGELHAHLDAEAEANVIMATLEGGVMLSMLYGDGSYASQAAQHVTTHVRSMAR
ncbi:MAG: TetR family transcriptional regulator [Gemmatimonadetes bacterium]|nr:TetR family transcriptional regulator [Gemmatimonadota bacterium]